MEPRRDPEEFLSGHPMNYSTRGTVETSYVLSKGHAISLNVPMPPNFFYTVSHL